MITAPANRLQPTVARPAPDVIPVVRRRSEPDNRRSEPSRGEPASSPASSSSLSSSAWLPKESIDYGEWEAQGRWLGSIGRCSQWWIGDWVRFGTSAYGEKYSLAAKLTGYDEHSLRNIAYVASRFAAVSRRRNKLSFSHHAELAALPEDDQELWLARAERERLSVAALRKELRAHRSANKALDAEAQGAEEASGQEASEGHARLCCPNCGHSIDLAAEASR